MNPLYNATNNNNPLFQRFQAFKSQFKGDPQAQVQQLLNSGKVTQAQYDAAVQQARNLQKMLGM